MWYEHINEISHFSAIESCQGYFLVYFYVLYVKLTFMGLIIFFFGGGGRGTVDIR